MSVQRLKMSPHVLKIERGVLGDDDWGTLDLVTNKMRVSSGLDAVVEIEVILHEVCHHWLRDIKMAHRVEENVCDAVAKGVCQLIGENPTLVREWILTIRSAYDDDASGESTAESSGRGDQ